MTSQQGCKDTAPAVAELIAEFERHVVSERIGRVLWPGVTVHRFTEPAEAPRIEKAGTVAIVIVAQGGTATVVSGTRQSLQAHARSQPAEPRLCLILQVDPRLIRKLWDAIAPYRVRRAPGDGESICAVETETYAELIESAVRLLRAVASESDCRVLAPLFLEETVYRLLQSDHGPSIIGLAVPEEPGPVADTLEFIANNLGEPLTVAELARRVHLSASSLSRVFRETTGSSPYQYVKEARLVRSRELLCVGRDGIGTVAHHVGYVSSSHFIKEFRNRFGTTPGDFLSIYQEDMSRRAPVARSPFALQSELQTLSPALRHDREIDIVTFAG